MNIDITSLDNWREIHFAWYLEELKQHGYILGYQNHAVTFKLGEPEKFKCVKQPLPKKLIPKVEERELVSKDTYTPDFIIYWTKKAEGIFFEKVGVRDRFGEKHVALDKNTPFWTYWSIGAVASRHFELCPVLRDQYDISLVDVKPDVKNRFVKDSSSIYTFPIEQKWVLDKYSVFVQKVVAEGKKTCLFAKTFTPRRYLINDKIETRRNIHHDTPNIESYVLNKKKEYERIKGRYNPQGLLFPERSG